MTNFSEFIKSYNQEYFTDSTMTYSYNGEMKFYIKPGYAVHYENRNGVTKPIDYINHIEGDDYITISCEDGSQYIQSVDAALNLDIYRIEKIVTI